VVQTTTKLLRRSKKDMMIGGVAAGVGNYAGISPTIIRFGWLVFTLVGGAGILAYLIAWTIIPDEDGRRTVIPLLLVGLGILLPFLFALLWLMPVTVTTTR
jgi:phage shock protein C